MRCPRRLTPRTVDRCHRPPKRADARDAYPVVRRVQRDGDVPPHGLWVFSARNQIRLLPMLPRRLV